MEGIGHKEHFSLDLRGGEYLAAHFGRNETVPASVSNPYRRVYGSNAGYSVEVKSGDRIPCELYRAPANDVTHGTS